MEKAKGSGFNRKGRMRLCKIDVKTHRIYMKSKFTRGLG